MMNFWTPTWYPWNESFSDHDMPWEARYDYVETYRWNDYTNGFELYWRDDFDYFDSSKWYTSDNWGFEGNSSLFVANQVSTHDGNLIITMDYAPGHADKDVHFLHETYHPHGYDEHPVHYPAYDDPHGHEHHEGHWPDDTDHEVFYDKHAYEPLIHHTHDKPHYDDESGHMVYGVGHH